MASPLWTPPSANPHKRPAAVSEEHASIVRQWEQSVLSMMHQTGGILDYWNEELKKIDRNLRLMQAMPLASAPGVKAGYYHLVRFRDPVEGTFMMVQPLHDAEGNFVEPTSGMLDMLKWADLQSDQIVRARQENDRRAAESAERAQRNADEARLDQGVELYKSLTNTQISVSKDVK